MTAEAAPERSAFLIGAWNYRKLQPVPAAAVSLSRMADLLTGDLCGWQPDEVHVVRDRELPDGLPAQMVELLSPARDVALFYFVGHGQPDFEGQLCLAMTGSSAESRLRRVSSLEFESVRHALRLSKARTKIVVLDCCYANLAGPSIGRLGPADLISNLRTGAFIMAACSEYGLASFETEPVNGTAQTCFTKYLVDTVERGIEGEGPRLRLGPLFNRVAEDMARAGLPIPASNTSDYATEFEFADNAAYHAADRAEAETTSGAHPHPAPSSGSGTGDAGPPALREYRRRADQAAYFAAGAAGGGLAIGALAHGSAPAQTGSSGATSHPAPSLTADKPISAHPLHDSSKMVTHHPVAPGDADSGDSGHAAS